jgi:hypothetical protein
LRAAQYGRDRPARTALGAFGRRRLRKKVQAEQVGYALELWRIPRIASRPPASAAGPAAAPTGGQRKIVNLAAIGAGRLKQLEDRPSVLDQQRLEARGNRPGRAGAQFSSHRLDVDALPMQLVQQLGDGHQMSPSSAPSRPLDSLLVK